MSNIYRVVYRQPYTTDYENGKPSQTIKLTEVKHVKAMDLQGAIGAAGYGLEIIEVLMVNIPAPKNAETIPEKALPE